MNQHLARILSAIETAKTHARDALMVFDLDGTLYDNSHRTLRLIQEFAWTHAARLPELYEGVRGLRADEIRYLVKDTLIACGVSDPAVHKEVHGYWFERFFTNDYLLYDLPLPGGAQVVQKLFGAGGVPAYLTGRDAPNMLLGTLQSLQRDGFPVGTVDTRVILKPDFETSDKAYKKSVIEHLHTSGEVVAVFDNEPGLCNMFHEAFPQASVFWLDTSCAPNPPALVDGVVTIPDFRAILS